MRAGDEADRAERRWWLEQWPAGEEFIAGLIAQDVQEQLADRLCALGGMTPYPVLSALEHFPQDFGLAPQTEQDLAKV